MKLKNIAYTILVSTVTLITVNSLVLGRMIDTVTKAVSDAEVDDTTLAETEYTEIYEAFKKKERYISLTVNHNDLMNIENSFAELIGAAKADDKESLIIAKSRLIDALGHLKRLSGINLDSIL